MEYGGKIISWTEEVLFEYCKHKSCELVILLIQALYILQQVNFQKCD